MVSDQSWPSSSEVASTRGTGIDLSNFSVEMQLHTIETRADDAEWQIETDLHEPLLTLQHRRWLLRRYALKVERLNIWSNRTKNRDPETVRLLDLRFIYLEADKHSHPKWIRRIGRRNGLYRRHG